MTPKQCIYELRDIIRRNNLFDDDRLDDRLLKHWLNNQRALWIRNDMNKPHSVDEQIIQTIGCAQLEVADKSSCPSFTTGYSVLQTVDDLPKIIELNNGDGIVEVGPVDKIAIPFSYINIHRARYAGNGRFNANIIHAFRYGLKILLIAKNMDSGSFLKYLRYLRIRAIFEDPEALSVFTHVNGDACYSEDDDYPMNSWMWNYIRDAIIKANFELLVQAPTDKVNDASETLKTDENG